jgi:hypothetical protein
VSFVDDLLSLCQEDLGFIHFSPFPELFLAMFFIFVIVNNEVLFLIQSMW